MNLNSLLAIGLAWALSLLAWPLRAGSPCASAEAAVKTQQTAIDSLRQDISDLGPTIEDGEKLVAEGLVTQAEFEALLDQYATKQSDLAAALVELDTRRIDLATCQASQEEPAAVLQQIDLVNSIRATRMTALSNAVSRLESRRAALDQCIAQNMSAPDCQSILDAIVSKQAALASARAKLALAQADEERIRTLFRFGIVTQADVDAAAAATQAAQTSVQTIENDLASLQAQLADCQAVDPGEVPLPAACESAQQAVLDQQDVRDSAQSSLDQATQARDDLYQQLETAVLREHRPDLTLVARPSELEIHLPVRHGYRYQLQSSSGLDDWRSVGFAAEPQTDNDDFLTSVQPEPIGNLFFHVQIQLSESTRARLREGVLP